MTQEMRRRAQSRRHDTEMACPDAEMGRYDRTTGSNERSSQADRTAGKGSLESWLGLLAATGSGFITIGNYASPTEQFSNKTFYPPSSGTNFSNKTFHQPSYSTMGAKEKLRAEQAASSTATGAKTSNGEMKAEKSTRDNPSTTTRGRTTNESKDKESKDKESKDKESKDKESKDKESKDKESKDKESKDNESKDNESEDNRSEANQEDHDDAGSITVVDDSQTDLEHAEDPSVSSYKAPYVSEDLSDFSKTLADIEQRSAGSPSKVHSANKEA